MIFCDFFVVFVSCYYSFEFFIFTVILRFACYLFTKYIKVLSMICTPYINIEARKSLKFKNNAKLKLLQDIEIFLRLGDKTAVRCTFALSIKRYKLLLSFMIY